MQVNSITHNIIKSSSCDNTENIHLLVDHSYSLFDKQLSSIDNILIFPIDDNSYNEYISYDLILSNNPINFSSKIKDFESLHINSIVYFHTKCHHNFKKEDKFLLKNALRKAYKIFANQYLLNNWSFELGADCSVLNYGVGANIEQIQQKTVSVMVLNTNNNPSVNILYEHIKKVFKDAIIVNSSMNDDTYQILQQTAICIETESYFNILYAIANGCYVITATDYIQEPGVFCIDSYDNVIKYIYSILQSYDYNIVLKNKNNILEKYNNEQFKQNFISIIQQKKREPFIYAQTN